MWDYSEKVMDHYRNPRNVGVIEDASAIGTTGNISCGDSLTLYLKIDENNVITDAKFQTFGCGSAVASSSILTELIIGKTVEEAQKITNKDIAESLGGLPTQKLHCSVMGKEALDDALEKYTGVKREVDDRVICKCFDVKESTLRHLIKENNLDTIEKIQNYTKACSACQHCREDIEKIMREELNIAEEEKKQEIPLTKTQMILKINKVLENYISEELRKDGGDIELIDYEDNKVFVKLQGACKICPSSTLTLKNFVEKTLKEHISKNIEVEQV